MPHVVCEPCVDCRYTDCVEVCPVGCFRLGEHQVYIDPELCIDCESCVPECPVEAIFLDENVPEQWRHCIDLNAEMAAKCEPISEKQTPLADE